MIDNMDPWEHCFFCLLVNGTGTGNASDRVGLHCVNILFSVFNQSSDFDNPCNLSSSSFHTRTISTIVPVIPCKIARGHGDYSMSKTKVEVEMKYLYSYVWSMPIKSIYIFTLQLTHNNKLKWYAGVLIQLMILIHHRQIP